MMDDDDDWMNPQRSQTWVHEKHADGTFYWIQRKRAIPVSGNVSTIYRWEMWSEHATKEERDEKLALLRKEHPSWYLRARTVLYINGDAQIHDPSEYMDF